MGNITSLSDSVMGQWTFGYDDLNRLGSASVTSGTLRGSSITGQTMNWSYDDFGNRTAQTSTGGVLPSAAGQYGSNNQFNMTASYSYDEGGNITYDGANNYTYDPENRVCAQTNIVANTNWVNVYGADGARVARGNINNNSTSCAVTAANGYSPVHTSVLGQSGEEFSEIGPSNTWSHTNVFANGELLATYTPSGLHYATNDWLGTKRGQANSAGAVESIAQSLPFGDGFWINTAADSTPHHFTGQIHDAESGNDYFEARFYNSSSGRFLSPDPSSLSVIRTDPQTWNRYSYVYNNPLSLKDENGKWPTAIHNQIIDNAFPNLTPEQRQILKNVSAQQDSILGGGQANDLSYEHAMRGPDQTVDQAQGQYNDFVAGAEGKASDLQNVQVDPDEQGAVLSPESLVAFGQALHAILDSTSPAHAGFQKWDWRNPGLVWQHHFAENSINQQQMQNAVRAARNAFNSTYGYFGFQAEDKSSVTTSQGPGTPCGVSTGNPCP